MDRAMGVFNTFMKHACFLTALLAACLDNNSFAAFCMATAVFYSVQSKEA